jgi:hypothetical protein
VREPNDKKFPPTRPPSKPCEKEGTVLVCSIELHSQPVELENRVSFLYSASVEKNGAAHINIEDSYFLTNITASNCR